MSIAQYNRLSLHVAATNRDVIRAAHTRLSDHGKSPAMREVRHQWLREMLTTHRRHQEFVRSARLYVSTPAI